MTVKVLVTQLGQQLFAETKHIENKETGDLVGYWLENPRVVNYSRAEGEDGGLTINFGPYCLVSDEASFSLRSEHVVAILEPRQDVLEAYTNLVTPPDTEAAVEGDATPANVEVTEDDATGTDSVEGSDDSGSTDGAAGDGTEGAS